MARHRILILLAVSVWTLMSCGSIPRGTFIADTQFKPDYSDASLWAALPHKRDSADAIPAADWMDVQQDAPVDIFFLHPTTYIGRSGERLWNGKIDDEKLNLRTDQSTIRYQASAFNGVGKIYAPRYRQAHLHCFYDQKKLNDARGALELAYQDVKSSFLYYLEHWNHDRPFILAAHSQGTFHAARLIKEHIEGTPLQEKLIVAYLVGMPVRSDFFTALSACNTPTETNCFCSWRSYKDGHIPRKQHFPNESIVVTNPVTWNAQQPVAIKSIQKGAVLRPFEVVRPHAVETRVYKDLLWVTKPKFPGSILFLRKNYHIADYNLFYADIRQNALDRTRAYLAHP